MFRLHRCMSRVYAHSVVGRDAHALYVPYSVASIHSRLRLVRADEPTEHIAKVLADRPKKSEIGEELHSMVKDAYKHTPRYAHYISPHEIPKITKSPHPPHVIAEGKRIFKDHMIALRERRVEDAHNILQRKVMSEHTYDPAYADAVTSQVREYLTIRKDITKAMLVLEQYLSGPWQSYFSPLPTILIITALQNKRAGHRIDQLIRDMKLLKQNVWQRQIHGPLYRSLVNAALACGRLKHADGLVSEYLTNHHPSDEDRVAIFAPYFKLYSQKNNLSAMVNMLNSMKERFDVSPNDDIINLCMDSCAETGNEDLAARFLEGMLNLHLPVSTRSFNLLLKVYLRQRNLSKMLYIWQTMRENEIPRDVYSYGTMITGYRDTSMLINGDTRNLPLRERMKSKGPLDRLGRNCTRLYEDMIAQGIKPNRFLLNLMWSCVSRFGQVKRVEEYEADANIPKNAQTYAYQAELAERTDDYRGVIERMNEAKREGYDGDEVFRMHFYPSLIRMSFKKRNHRALNDWMDVMHEEKMDNYYCYMQALNLCVYREDVVRFTIYMQRLKTLKQLRRQYNYQHEHALRVNWNQVYQKAFFLYAKIPNKLPKALDFYHRLVRQGDVNPLPRYESFSMLELVKRKYGVDPLTQGSSRATELEKSIVAIVWHLLCTKASHIDNASLVKMLYAIMDKLDVEDMKKFFTGPLTILQRHSEIFILDKSSGLDNNPTVSLTKNALTRDAETMDLHRYKLRVARMIEASTKGSQAAVNVDDDSQAVPVNSDDVDKDGVYIRKVNRAAVRHGHIAQPPIQRALMEVYARNDDVHKMLVHLQLYWNTPGATTELPGAIRKQVGFCLSRMDPADFQHMIEHASPFYQNVLLSAKQWAANSTKFNKKKANSKAVKNKSGSSGEA